MTEFIITLAVSSFACVGLRVVTTDGMVLGVLSRWAQKWPDWLAKPLVRCVACYASVYGTLLYWLLIDEWSWKQYPVFVLALAFLNYLFYSLLLLVDIAGDHEDAKLKVVKYTYKNINF